MSAALPRRQIRWETWALAAEADRRFNLTVAVVGAATLALALFFSYLKLDLPQHAGNTFNTPRYVDLLPEKPAEVAKQNEEPKPAEETKKAPPEPPKPKPEIKPVEKPVTKPEPVPVPEPTAKERVDQQFRNQFNVLNDLRTQSPTLNSNPLVSESTITSKGGIGSAGGGESIASSAASSSGGIGSTGGGVTAQQSGVGLGSHRTKTVESNIGFGRHVTETNANGKTVDSGRTHDEIQVVFDRNQSAFYAIFNRYLREHENADHGTIVVNLTIAEDGSVSQCKLVSSTFNDPDLEDRIIQRVRLMNFGAKSVPPFTFDYPINLKVSG